MITPSSVPVLPGLPWIFGGKDGPLPPFEPAVSRRGRDKGPRARVLVIDDEPAIADSLTEILLSNGYDAQACYDGQSALDAARTICPDIVLSDVILPKRNGVDIAIAIRELCPAARIILFSGQASTADLLAKAHGEGFDFELLSKPIHPNRLLRKLSGDC